METTLKKIPNRFILNGKEVSFNEYVGLRIKKFREEKGFKQVELSEETSVSDCYYSKIELGIHGMSLLNACDTCRALEIDLKDLVPPETLIQDYEY